MFKILQGVGGFLFGGGSVYLEGYILKLAFSHYKALPYILPRRIKLQFKIIFEEDPVRSVPIASAQQYHIYIIQIFIYIFSKRKITENVLQNTPNCTIDKKSGE